MSEKWSDGQIVEVIDNVKWSDGGIYFFNELPEDNNSNPILIIIF